MFDLTVYLAQVSHNSAENEKNKFLTKPRSQIYESLEQVSTFFLCWLPLTALIGRGQGLRTARCSCRSGSHPEHPLQGWSAESRELMMIQEQLGKDWGREGSSWHWQDSPLCRQTRPVLTEQVPQATFPLHPTNLSKLNCNEGGSRKLSAY